MNFKIVRPFIVLFCFMLCANNAAAQNTEQHGSAALRIYYSDLNQTLSKYQLNDVPFQREQIQVQADDSLLTLAKRHRFRELDFFHLAAALYETNFHAFYNGDASHLETGSTIKLPTVGGLFNAQERYEKLKVVGEGLDFNNDENQMRTGLRWPFGKSLVLIGPHARDELPRNQEVTLTSYRPDVLSIKGDSAASDFLSFASHASVTQRAESSNETVAKNATPETGGSWLDQSEVTTPIAESFPVEDAGGREVIAKSRYFEADAIAVAEAKAKTETKARAVAKALSEADAEAIALVESAEKAEAAAKVQAEAEAKVLAKAKAKARAKVLALIETVEKAEAAAKLKAKAEAKALAEAKAVADAVAEAKAKAQVEAVAKKKAEAEAEAMAKAVLDAEAKALAKTKADTEAKAKVLAAEAQAKEKKERAEANALAKAIREEAKAEAKALARAQAQAKEEAENIINSGKLAEQLARVPNNEAQARKDTIASAIAVVEPAIANDTSLDASKKSYLGAPKNSTKASSNDISADPLSYIVEWNFDSSATVGAALNRLANYIGYELVSEDDIVLNTYTRRLPAVQRRVSGVSAEDAFTILAGRGLATVFDHVARSVKHIPRQNRKLKPIVTTASASGTHEKFMRQTGISAMLKRFPNDILNAADRHADRCDSTADIKTPDAQRLYNLVVGRLQQKTPEPVTRNLVEWYESPTGRKVLELDRGEIDEVELQQFIVNTNRVDRIQQIYNNTVTGKGIASIAVELDYAGWSLSGCKQTAENSGDVQQMHKEMNHGQVIKNKSAKLESILREDMLRPMAYLFAPLSDKELTEYAEITKQHAGIYTELQQSILDAIVLETKELTASSSR